MSMALERSLRYRQTTAIAIALVAVAACSGSSDGTSTAASAAPTGKASAPPSPAAIKVTVAPGTGKAFVGARRDVTGWSCKQAGKAWTTVGSVTNSGKVTANYRIYTAFVTTTNETKGLLQTNVVGVAPKATKKWADKLDLSGTGLRCDLRVERTNA